MVNSQRWENKNYFSLYTFLYFLFSIYKRERGEVLTIFQSLISSGKFPVTLVKNNLSLL